jgi:uncharacterized protein YhaN
MTDCLGRFERALQPEILRHVTHLFERLTSGRYVAIRRQLSDKKSLVVEQCDGQIKEPWQLSTGTREQLYLAIRLAYVLQYCREAEPLPIVMDDVLVNFDEQRAHNTLQVLREVSESVQVVLLTCHKLAARATLEVIPDAKAVLLGESFLDEQPVASTVATSKRRARPGRDENATERGPQRSLDFGS